MEDEDLWKYVEDLEEKVENLSDEVEEMRETFYKREGSKSRLRKMSKKILDYVAKAGKEFIRPYKYSLFREGYPKEKE